MAENERKTVPMRISYEALYYIKIAAAYKGMTISDYVSDALLQKAKDEIEVYHSRMKDRPNEYRNRDMEEQ